MELFLETILYLFSSIFALCLTIIIIGVGIVIVNSLQIRIVLLIFIIQCLIGMSISERDAEHLSISILGLVFIGVLWFFDDYRYREAKVCLIIAGTVVAVVVGIVSSL